MWRFAAVENVVIYLEDISIPMFRMHFSGVSLRSSFAPTRLSMPEVIGELEADEGRVVFRAKADERHTNPMGAIHGGFAATVLDAATGCAIHTLLPAGVGYGTVDLNVKMVRLVPMGEELHAVAGVIDRTRTIAISEGTLTNADGKIFAHATATLRILGREKAA